MKKLFSGALALVIGASMLPAAFANEADSITVPGETVLYYNTFPTGTYADLPEVEHELYYFYGRNDKLKYALNEGMEYIHNTDTAAQTHTYHLALDPLQASEFNGDTGVRVRTNCSLGAGPVVMLDFRYSDAAKTPTADGALKSGVYRSAFDFVLDSANTSTNGFRVEANCKHGNCGNSFAWMMNNTWHNLSGGNTWSYTEKDVAITNNELHHYEIVFDLDSNKAITYMDGVRRKDTSFGGNINFLHLTIGGKMKYVDNILFAKVNDDVSMDIGEVAYENGTLIADMSNSVADPTAITDAFSIKNIYTDEIIPATAKCVTSKEIEITPETALVPGYEYELLIDDGVEGVSATEATENDSYWFNIAENNAVYTLKFRDFTGEEKSFAKTTVAEIDALVFEFTEDVNATGVLSKLSIKDSEGKAVAYSVEATDAANVAEVMLPEAFVGTTEYEMALPGLTADYKWSFTTEDGNVGMKPIKLFAEDGVTPIELSSVSVGDKIKAQMTIINTEKREGAYNCLFTAGLYSENSLDDFDYEDVTLESGVNVFSKTVEFTVTDTTDLKLKGFVWKALGSRVPLIGASVVE